MDTKIKSRFWPDPQVEALDRDGKLSLLWLLTAHITDCGYVECSPRRFEFETGSPWQALIEATEALGGSVVRTAKGFWVRNYIREQVGVGESLANNNMGKAVVRQLKNVPPEIQQLVLRQYPELKALAKPYLSPSRTSRSTGEERRGEERSSEDEGLGEGEALELPPGVEFPPGFPETERQALAWVAGLARPSDLPAVDPEFVLEIFHAMPGVGFKDGAERVITHWGKYVLSRWRKGRVDLLAKRSEDGRKKNGGAENGLGLPKGAPVANLEAPAGWKAASIDVVGFEPESWEALPAASKADVRAWLAKGK
jgi:hypothetical protein